MKILYIITKGNWGGAQRYVYNLASNLPKDKFEAVVTFGEGKGLEEKLKEKGIRTMLLKNSQRDINLIKDFLLFFELIRLYKREKPDLIHLNSSKVGALGVIAARIYAINSKTIFTAHGWAFKENRGTIFKVITKSISWLVVVLCQKVIVVSKDDFEKSKRFWLAKKKIIYIPNGIRQTEFLDKVIAREKLGLPKEKTLVGTISELHENKGLDILIKGFSKITTESHDLDLVIIGSGEEKLRLERLVGKNNLQDRIRFLSFIDNAERYLKVFDIFTLTSRKEGLPFSLLEAGLASLPVIATNVGGIPEVIHSGENGILIDSENPEELASRIKYLAKNPKKRKLLGKNLYERIKTEYSFENMLKSTVRLYAEMLK